MKDKKLINSKTAVSKLTSRFTSYGVIILLIYKIIETLIQKTILNNFTSNQILLYVTLSLSFSIILLITMHILCRVSTHDVLKKYKLDNNEIDIISKKLTKIFVFFIFLSIIITIAQLYFSFNYESKIQAQSIVINNIKYKDTLSSEALSILDNQAISDFYTYKTNFLTYTFILELGFCISLIAIAPFQKDMIKLYNS